jgi:hypothetical protein
MVTLEDTCKALRAATDDALRDYRTAYRKHADCDAPDAYGIREVETPYGELMVMLGYRSVERKRGAKPSIWRTWLLNGKPTTASAFNRMAGKN